MAEKNERSFTEDQLRASEGQLNLQMGFNKGASQSGHGGFGNTRHMWMSFYNVYIKWYLYLKVKKRNKKKKH